MNEPRAASILDFIVAVIRNQYCDKLKWRVYVQLLRFCNYVLSFIFEALKNLTNQYDWFDFKSLFNECLIHWQGFSFTVVNQQSVLIVVDGNSLLYSKQNIKSSTKLHLWSVGSRHFNRLEKGEGSHFIGILFFYKQQLGKDWQTDWVLLDVKTSTYCRALIFTCHYYFLRKLFHKLRAASWPCRKQ